MNVGIIGLGNPLRSDDGIGIVLLHRIQAKKKPAWHDFEFLDGGTGGLSLVHDLSRFTHVLLIDAIDFQGTPGQYHIFSANDLLQNSTPLNTFSTHEPGLLEVLRLADQMHTLPSIVKIFGVQPESFTYNKELSPRVMDQLGALTRNLAALLDQLPRLR